MRTLQSFLLVGVVCAAAAALLPGCGSTPASSPSGEAGAPGAAGAATGAAGAATGAAGAATGAAGAPATLVGDATRGATAYVAKSCNTCHGDSTTSPPAAIPGAGSLGPNITGSSLPGLGGGIGTWTEAQFHDAVRLAININGSPLCELMVKFPAMSTGQPGSIGVSDQDIADMYTYLEGEKATVALQGMYCPTG